MSDLTFAALRTANVERLPTFRDRQGRLCHPVVEGRLPGYDWAPSQWCNAVLGELGELANYIKKVERGDRTLEEGRQEISDELCDVVTYLDLLAYRLEIDIDRVIRDRWTYIDRRALPPQVPVSILRTLTLREPSDHRLSRLCAATLPKLGRLALHVESVEADPTLLRGQQGYLGDMLYLFLGAIDRVAHRAGVDLDTAIVTKWNRVSERVGSPVRLDA